MKLRGLLNGSKVAWSCCDACALQVARAKAGAIAIMEGRHHGRHSRHGRDSHHGRAAVVASGELESLRPQSLAVGLSQIAMLWLRSSCQHDGRSSAAAQ